MTSLRLRAVVCLVAAVTLSGCASITRTVGERHPAPASPAAAIPSPSPTLSPSAAASAQASESGVTLGDSPLAGSLTEPSAGQQSACVVGKWRLNAWLEVVNASTWDPKASDAVTIQAIANGSGALGTLTLGADGRGSQTLDVTLTGETDSHAYTAAFHGTATFTYTVTGSALTYSHTSGSFKAELGLDHVAVRTASVPLSTNPYELDCTDTTLTLRATHYAYAFDRS
jgi:hypothetical protein